MTNIENKGGIFMGNSHADGGIDVVVPETGQQLEVEGNEPLIPKEAFENNTITEYTGTNFEILNKINQSVGAKGLNKKATTIHAGDVVICKKTLLDKTIKTIKGTNKQVVSAINAESGCNVIEQGATIQNKNGEVMQFKKGGQTQNLLAPNGKPTNLTPEQYKLVRTPEFKVWFGDWENNPETASKVIDENGEPLVCYHRSKKIFSLFDVDKQLNGWLGKGFYFSESKLEFKEYGSKLLSVFLNIINPFSVKGESPSDFLYELKKMFDNNEHDTTQILKDNNYDGVIYKHWDFYSRIYSCFNSNQIKLANGTNTTFDENNQDIRFENGGTITNMNELLTDLYKDHHQAWATMQKISNEVCENNCQTCVAAIVLIWEEELQHHFKEEEEQFFPHVKSQNNKLNNLIVDELIIQHHWFLQKITEINKKPTPANIKQFCNKLIEHIKLEEYLMSKFMNDPFNNQNIQTIDKPDNVTMDIPLLIRTLELAREDIKTDADLHRMVERLIELKNKEVLTMDDYDFIEGVKNNPEVIKLENGGQAPLKPIPNTPIKMKKTSNVWTDEQREKVYQLDQEFEKELKAKKINPNSKEASDFWRSGGYKNQMRAIFGKKPMGVFDEFRVIHKADGAVEEQSESFDYFSDAIESFDKHNAESNPVRLEGWSDNNFEEVLKFGTKKLKNGGEIDTPTQTIVFEPKTIAELENSLKIMAADKNKTSLYIIQNNFFNEVVSYNPTMLLPLLKLGKELLNKSDRFNFDRLIDMDYQDANTKRFFDNLSTPLWKLIPAELRKVNPIKTLQFKPTPNDENLAKITDLFVGTDDWRPNMQGVYFDIEHRAIVATNAHIMLHINEKPQVLNDEICILGKNTKKYSELIENEGKTLQKTKDGCLVVDAKYPQWSRVIPRDFEHVVTIKTDDLYRFCKIIADNNLTNRTTGVVMLLTEQFKIGVNVHFLQDCLKAMLLLGYQEIDMAFQSSNQRAILIVPKGNLRKISSISDDIETDFTLIMPVNIDLQKGYIFTYDLEKKCIENQGLEQLGCVDLDDITETNIETTLIKKGDFVVKKYTNNKFYLVKSVDGNKLTLINTTSLKQVSNANASDYETVKKENIEDVKYAYNFNKRKALTDDLKQTNPIVLEWTEGADIENKPYQNIEELEKDLKSFGFTDTPNETYIKNKVWFRDYPHYINIDLSKSDHDFNPEEQRLIDWLKKYDSKFDFTPFSEEEKTKQEQTKQQKTNAIKTLQLLYDLADINDKESIMLEINKLQTPKVQVRGWDKMEEGIFNKDVVISMLNPFVKFSFQTDPSGRGISELVSDFKNSPQYKEKLISIDIGVGSDSKRVWNKNDGWDKDYFEKEYLPIRDKAEELIKDLYAKHNGEKRKNLTDKDIYQTINWLNMFYYKLSENQKNRIDFINSKMEQGGKIPYTKPDYPIKYMIEGDKIIKVKVIDERDVNGVIFAFVRGLYPNSPSKLVKKFDLFDSPKEAQKFGNDNQLGYFEYGGEVSTVADFKTWAAKKNLELINEVEGFKVGDEVSYTNEYGVVFEPYTIIGIEKDDSFYGRQIYLNTEAYWFPHKPSELKHYKK